MAEERFCELCGCHGKKEEGLPSDLLKNFTCPLLSGKKICVVCCHYELEGGMGASDTLLDMMRKSGKSAWDVHQTCVGCPHGGPELDKPHKLISVMGKDGVQKESGPEFDEAQKESDEWFLGRLERLKTLKIEEDDRGPVR